MSNKDGFIDSLKHMVFEDEPESQKPVHSPTPSGAAPTLAPISSGTAPQPVFTGPRSSDDDEVYRRILAKTDFDSTDVGTNVQKFLQPLANLPMDAALKFKTAVAQAKAQNGLTEEKILAAFDNLKASLRREQDAFTAKAAQFSAAEITGRQNRITEISAQITKLQQELGQLSGELVEAQGRAAHAQGQFSAALERRSTEIEQQKAQYAALLK
jgi:hypothetical protein